MVYMMYFNLGKAETRGFTSYPEAMKYAERLNITYFYLSPQRMD